MLKSLGHDTERESLNSCLGFVPRGPIGENPRQIGDFADPPAVVFALELNLERHPAILRQAI
jgi:hypothetical protein